MAYNKKTWLARLGQGLNKFSIDGATPVPIINQPDSVTQQGDALSAGNLNDLEQRIADAFDDVEESKADKSTTDAQQSQINQHESRLENLEQKAGDYTTVQYRGTNAVPTGKAKNGLVEKIVGKTRAWNQLVENGNFVDTSGWTGVQGTIAVNNNKCVFTAGSTLNRNARLQRSLSVPSGHALLVGAYVKPSRKIQCYLSTDAGSSTAVTVSANVETLVIGLIPAQSSATTTLYLFCNDTTTLQQNDTVEFSEVFVRDLSITLHEYTSAQLETLGVSGVLSLLTDLGKYDAYDAGSLVSTEVSSVKSVGVNIWDEEMELGRINVNTGGLVNDTTRLRSKNYLQVVGGDVLYLLFPTGADIDFNYVFYDANYNYVLGDFKTTNTSITVPTNARYMKFYMGQGYGTTYNHDIQICLNSYADKTTYHPYKTDTLSLSEPVTLRSAGSVVDELYVETGEATHPVGSHIFDGTESLSPQDTIGNFELVSCELPNAKNIGSIYSSDFLDDFGIPYMNGPQAKLGAYRRNTAIYMTYDSTVYSTKALFLASLVGKTIYYELATPTTESIYPITDNFIEVEGGGTINTIQEQTPVIDNCLDVGYLTV